MTARRGRARPALARTAILALLALAGPALAGLALAGLALAGLALASPARAEEGGASAEPISSTVQFIRSSQGRIKIWLVEFRINAANAADLTRITERMPRVTDQVLVSLSRGAPDGGDPSIQEVKDVVTHAIEARIGPVEGIDVVVLKLKAKI